MQNRFNLLIFNMFMAYVFVVFFLIFEMTFLYMSLYSTSSFYIGRWVFWMNSEKHKCMVKVQIFKNEGSALDYSSIIFKFESDRCELNFNVCNNSTKKKNNLIILTDKTIMFKDYMFLAGIMKSKTTNDAIILEVYLTDVFLDIDTFCIIVEKHKNIT